MPKSYDSPDSIVKLHTKVLATVDEDRKFKDIPPSDKPLWMAKKVILWLCLEMMSGNFKYMNPIKLIKDIFGFGKTFAYNVVNEPLRCM